MIERMQQLTLVLQMTCQASVHALRPTKMPSKRCENICYEVCTVRIEKRQTNLRIPYSPTMVRCSWLPEG